MTKAARQAKLLRIVRTHRLRTQEDLGAALARAGAAASQVTLSRDLRELGVVKTRDGYREAGAAVGAGADELRRVLREFLVEARAAQNLVVLKTRPGGAAAAALALDRAGWAEIVGTVAGDDTIFAAASSAGSARAAARKLSEIVAA